MIKAQKEDVGKTVIYKPRHLKDFKNRQVQFGTIKKLQEGGNLLVLYTGETTAKSTPAELLFWPSELFEK